MPLTPPLGLRNAVIRPRRIPCTTSTGTSAQKLLSYLPQHLAVPSTVEDTFKCSVVIPEGPPPCRTRFKNLSCVAGLCRISSSGSGALSSGGLLRDQVFRKSTLIRDHPERGEEHKDDI